MNGDDEIRTKALMAMKAVTAGALLCAGLSCFSEADDDDEVSTSTQRQQAQQQEEGESPDSTPHSRNDSGADEASDDGEPSESTPQDSEDAGTGQAEALADTGTDRRDTDDSASEEANDGGFFEGLDPFADDEDDEQVADTGDDKCNAQQSTGHCPEGCTVQDDVDCCQEVSGNCWMHGRCGPCVIPGPFVPPTMVA